MGERIQLPKFGEVYFMDLTPHTLPSKTTMKNDHRVIIIQNDKLFPNTYPNIIVIPTTSFNPENHWDFEYNRLKYLTHHLLKKDRYNNLKNDTIVKCEQIFTIEKQFLDRYLFTLNNEDMEEILKRVALIIGFQRI